MTTNSETNLDKYWQYALWLAIITILYNLAEGVFSVAFGATDGALTLFGFGIDSFIEVLSGLGILAMVVRIRSHPQTSHSQFERTALRITGIAFFILAAGLAVTAVYNLIAGHRPSTTLPGTIISLASIASMWLLLAGKRKVGRVLDSAPILADANCTLTCIYMSLVLLAASLIYQFTGFGFVDSLGSLGLIYFSLNEGKEAFEKARGISNECDCEGEE